MIGEKDKLKVINILNSALGVGTYLQDGDIAYHCPFCHHHKKKLYINVYTQQIHCWVCHAKGRSIKSFGKKIGMQSSELSAIGTIYSDDDYRLEFAVEEKMILKLPPEFKKLSVKPKSFNQTYTTAINYLTKRGVTMDMIIKWNIGYCESGFYANRVVIPSYDSNGELNFFTARAIDPNEYVRYKASKNTDVIIFENQINWREPITLVEGVFDAFSIRRNVIPLLSKNILGKLRDKIIFERPPLINICLDVDAISESVAHSKFFMDNGLNVKNVIPPETDFGDAGFITTNKLLKETDLTDWSDLIKTKLNTIK